MTTKSLLLTGTLVMASLSVGYAKSYELVFGAPVRAGNLQLGPGAYTVKVKGSTAVFTNVDTDRTYEAPAKIESAASKHGMTAVDINNQKGTRQIQKIELGGSTTDVDFGE